MGGLSEAEAKPERERRTLRRSAASAGALLFAAALLTGGAAAVAQEAPATTLAVTKQGYFTSKITGALPPVLVREVPPAPACVIVPQLCGGEVDALEDRARASTTGCPCPISPTTSFLSRYLPASCRSA